jgi:uncharacterized membrane protein YkgB
MNMITSSPYSAEQTGLAAKENERARRVLAAARVVALAGLVIPLVLIGVLKFTQLEVEALVPLIEPTPWLAWLYSVFGHAWTSYLLGISELVTAALLVASRWSTLAGLAAGALSSLTFAVTTSMLLTVPIWEPSLGGFPYLNFAGSFLIKDIALLGASLWVLGDALTRAAALERSSPARA